MLLSTGRHAPLCHRADIITVTDVAKEAATGKAVLHQHRDRLGRPVILVRAAKHVTGALPGVLSGLCGVAL